MEERLLVAQGERCGRVFSGGAVPWAPVEGRRREGGESCLCTFEQRSDDV